MKLEHTTTTTIDQDFFYDLFKDASPMDIAMCVIDAILAATDQPDAKRHAEVVRMIGARLASLGEPELMEQLHAATQEMAQP